MNRKILVMALGLSAMAAPAMAGGIVDVGDLSGADYANAESFKNGSNSSFTTTYNFTLSQSSVVHVSLTDSAKLTGLTASLYNVLPSGNVLQTTVGPLAGNGTTGDWQSQVALAAGTYKVDVVGSYATRGSYALELSSDVAAPVPGPAGFIVAGAGALIVASRRRRNKMRLAQA